MMQEKSLAYTVVFERGFWKRQREEPGLRLLPLQDGALFAYLPYIVL